MPVQSLATNIKISQTQQHSLYLLFKLALNVTSSLYVDLNSYVFLMRNKYTEIVPVLAGVVPNIIIYVKYSLFVSVNLFYLCTKNILYHHRGSHFLQENLNLFG